jgi:hypothetical protein
MAEYWVSFKVSACNKMKSSAQALRFWFFLFCCPMFSMTQQCRAGYSNEALASFSDINGLRPEGRF